MKNKLVAAILILTNTFVFGQSQSEENDYKNIRFGLKAGLSADWFQTEDDRKFLNNGSSLGTQWGIHFEYRLKPNASFVTGLGIRQAKGNINFSNADIADDVIYRLNRNEEFISIDDTSANTNLYILNNRKYTINYIDLPLSIKMKTKEIGYLTYYGIFGANLGIRTKARANDNSINVENNEETNIDKLNIDKDVFPIRAGLSIGGGAEYNLSGTTSLYFDLGYKYVLTNAVQKESEHLRFFDENLDTQKLNQRFIPGSFGLTVGILF